MEPELESALADPWARLHSKATHGLVATQFHLVHGDTVQVKGKILSDAKAFVVNLGQDRDNLILHFNPRFDFQTDANTIVCNSLHNGVWGKEERLTDFPFEQRGKVKVRAFLHLSVFGDKDVAGRGSRVFLPKPAGPEDHRVHCGGRRLQDQSSQISLICVSVVL
ncbi:16 kDa beta-galactoside-binding lectin-like isoform X2 [Rhineura floridana]|uniref:16 kDa beta-galactoside-binding lectin-like isoform X2 n=1 Tax=Rhineura floridana TaxID=261503 RepID=UPI002AC7FB15|nr:16 kDa beta-galactoside-binding lectin-like isoform X2 [Rhineura floridana]